MTIPVSPPPEPPALIRIERTEEPSARLLQQPSIAVVPETQALLEQAHHEPLWGDLDPDNDDESQVVTRGEIAAAEIATAEPVDRSMVATQQAQDASLVTVNMSSLVVDRERSGWATTSKPGQIAQAQAAIAVEEADATAEMTAEMTAEQPATELDRTEPIAAEADDTTQSNPDRDPTPTAQAQDTPSNNTPPTAPNQPRDGNTLDRDSFSIDADGLLIEPVDAIGAPGSTDTPSSTPSGSPATEEINGRNLQEPLRLSSPIEVTSDRQTFDRDRQIFSAIGNATMRYASGLLEADRIQVNLLTRMARAEGNITLTRNDGSVLRGDKIRYNFAQDLGTIENANGDITTTPSAETADSRRTIAVPPTTLLPVPIGTRYVADAPQSDRFIEDQPRDVYSPGGFNFRLGTGREFQTAQQLGGLGTLTRFRFDAQSIDFTPNGWTGNDVRITTDAFSPPESELRADRIVFTPLDPLRDEILMTRPRLVFDDSLSLPVLKRRYILDRSDREPPIVQFGFDQRDRDGFYIQRKFEIFNRYGVRFEIAPQFYVQRALTASNSSALANFGFTTQLTARINNRTSLAAESSLTDLDFANLSLEESLRASVRLTHLVLGDHRLTGEYTFRNRQFNGSLGFRTVHSSLGLVLNSPPIAIGNTGVVLTYQVGANRINAETDEAELLKPIRDTNRATLMRYQGSFSLDRGWNLWVGDALPATAEEGLRYSPVPVVPYVRFFAGVRGIAGFYSNGASETSLQGSVGLQAQFGHFSKPFLDYTSVFVRYSDSILSGQSPFPFDRVADQRIFSFGFLQQIIGPLRFGFQTAINIDNNDTISTDYILEYSRRTYGIILSINPQRESGSLQLRINDFDWNGNAGAFSNRETCQGIRDLMCD
jgi:lipopolysaccharide export system protein LptA